VSDSAKLTIVLSALVAAVALTFAAYAQEPQTSPPAGQSAAGSPQVAATTVRERPNDAEALVLLKRVEEILKNRTTTKDGDLKSAGKVMLDRADVVEMLSAIQQLRIMLSD
jgi:hypothetical protein